MFFLYAISESILNENSVVDIFSIYELLTSNPTPRITVLFTTADYTLPIQIDNGALISLFNCETFQKVNCKLNTSSLPNKSKLKTYSGEAVSSNDQSAISFSYEGNKIKTG